MKNWRNRLSIVLLFVLLSTSLVFPTSHVAAQICPDGYGQLKYTASNGSKIGFYDSSLTYASTDYCYTQINAGWVLNVNGSPRKVKNLTYYTPTLVDVYVCTAHAWWDRDLCTWGHWENIELVPIPYGQ